MGNFEYNGLTNITRKQHRQFQKCHISKTLKITVHSKVKVKFATLSKMLKTQQVKNAF
jgi:predicted RNA binding protein YcfA (HicA-like mRNA interferase family)